MSIYTLQEYNGTAWLSDPIHFTDFRELEDHMIATTESMEAHEAEEYYYNSVITETDNDNG